MLLSARAPRALGIGALVLTGCHCGGSSGVVATDVGPIDVVDASDGYVSDEGAETQDADSGAEAADAPARTDFGDATNPSVQGGYGPFVGAWHGVPGLPLCNALVATDPTASVGPMKWQPCASARIGCRSLVVDWTSARGGANVVWTPAVDPVRYVGGVPYITYEREFPGHGSWDYAIAVLQPLDGLPVLAVGTDFTTKSWCNLGVGIGDFGVLAFGRFGGYSGELLVASSSWPMPSDLRGYLLAYPSLGWSYPATMPQRFSVGMTRAFIETVTPSTISVLDLPGRAVVPPLAPSRPPSQEPHAVHGGAYATATTSPYGILFFADDGSWSQVIRPQLGRIPTEHAVDRQNGDALVWVESDRAPLEGFTNSVVWTSPYATAASGAVPRKVAALADRMFHGGAGMVANRGVLLATTSQTTAVLIRLSDGWGWQVDAEPDVYFVSPLWVDDDEVWLLTSLRSDLSTSLDGILRIRRDTLGAPTIPPGI